MSSVENQLNDSDFFVSSPCVVCRLPLPIRPSPITEAGQYWCCAKCGTRHHGVFLDNAPPGYAANVQPAALDDATMQKPETSVLPFSESGIGARAAQGTAKEALPNCLTLFGGCHATFWDEEALKECPQLDVIIRGEGEITLLDLVKKVNEGKSFNRVLGTTCRDGDKIAKNPDRAYIENLLH